jgi:hypothetical protein
MRVSHPECNISVTPDVVNELIDNRFIAVTTDGPGYQVLEITLRGFDYDAYMEQPTI